MPCFVKNLGISKNKGTPFLWNFAADCGLEKFLPQNVSHFAICCQLRLTLDDGGKLAIVVDRLS